MMAQLAIDFTPLSLAVMVGSVILAFTMLFCTWIMASMLRSCRLETAKIRKWFTEN